MRPSLFLRVSSGVTHVASLSALASSTGAHSFREAPAYPKRLKLFEMGPRDGLQSEARFVPTDVKV